MGDDLAPCFWQDACPTSTGPLSRGTPVLQARVEQRSRRRSHWDNVFFLRALLDGGSSFVRYPRFRRFTVQVQAARPAGAPGARHARCCAIATIRRLETTQDTGAGWLPDCARKSKAWYAPGAGLSSGQNYSRTDREGQPRTLRPGYTVATRVRTPSATQPKPGPSFHSGGGFWLSGDSRPDRSSRSFAQLRWRFGSAPGSWPIHSGSWSSNHQRSLLLYSTRRSLPRL